MSDEIEDRLVLLRSALDQFAMSFKDILPSVLSIKKSALQLGFNDEESFDLSFEAFRVLVKMGLSNE